MQNRPSALVKQDLMKIGQYITKWRKLKHLTKKELSVKSGVTVNTILNIENGTGSAKMLSLFAVLRAMGLSDIKDAFDPINNENGKELIWQQIK